MQPVGGELFDPEHTALLDSCVIDDAAWARALTSVALGAPGTRRRERGEHANFAELGVDQLGSIYEGLLMLEPFLAPGPRILGRVDGERRVLEEGAAEGYQVLRHLEAANSYSSRPRVVEKVPGPSTRPTRSPSSSPMPRLTR